MKTPRQRKAMAAATVGVSALGLVMAIGALLPPWPLISGKYYGQESPIANFIQVVFDYPKEHYASFIFVSDAPLLVSALEIAPVLLQAAIIGALTIGMLRLVAGLAREGSFAAQVSRSLSFISIVALGGGVVQFALGLSAWAVGFGWFTDMAELTLQQVTQERPPFPHWPVTLAILGILAAVLRSAFREGSRLKEDVELVV